MRRVPLASSATGGLSASAGDVPPTLADKPPVAPRRVSVPDGAWDKAMPKRRIVLILMGLAALAGVMFWLHQTRLAVGWLRGEAFYQGRPTSYWAAELEDWDMMEYHALGEGRVCRHVVTISRREPGLFTELWQKLSGQGEDRPPLFSGDPAAEPVLRELCDSPSEEVRAMA